MEYKKSLGQRILHFSFTKILIGIIVCTGIVILGQIGLEKLIDFSSLGQEYKNLIISIIVAILVLTSYTVLYKLYEKRRITELSGNGLSRNLFCGILLGIILQSLTIYVIYLNNGFLHNQVYSEHLLPDIQLTKVY